MAQQQAIHKFVLGNKEVDGKNAEFQYDHGWYSIVQINGEEKEILYKSRNAQEAYMKWNVYIGRKKERPVRDYGQSDAETRDNRNYRDRRRGGSQEEGRSHRNSAQGNNRSRSRNAARDTEEHMNSSRSQDNVRSQNSTKSVQPARSSAEKEEERRTNHSSDAHRNFEKRKARARRDWSRKRRAEEGGTE